MLHYNLFIDSYSSIQVAGSSVLCRFPDSHCAHDAECAHCTDE